MITHDPHIASNAKRMVKIIDGEIFEGDEMCIRDRPKEKKEPVLDIKKIPAPHKIKASSVSYTHLLWKV